MDRITRHQIKQDELAVTYEQVEAYVKAHFRSLALIVGIAVVVAGGAFGLRTYLRRQRAGANVALETALNTFNAYVGQSAPGVTGLTFPTADAKYKAALAQFTTVVEKYPRTEAAAIARIHVGICEGLLGNNAQAVRMLQTAIRVSNPEEASLARFSLANELARTGKQAEAEKIYEDLAAHPTLAVPRGTALMALADDLRATNPARAKQIYEELQKEFSSDPTLAQTFQQDSASIQQ